jgi:hypothetical protein
LGLLVAHQNKQYVYVYRTASLAEQPIYSFGRPGDTGNYVNFFIKNADIKVIDSDSATYQFQYHFTALSNGFIDSVYYSNIRDFNIQPNSRYFFDVYLNGDVILGETHTPGDFDIIYPINDQISNLSNGEYVADVIWTNSLNSLGYIIQLTMYSHSLQNTPVKDLYTYTVFDTLFSQQIPIRGDKPDSCVIDIYSFDINYYNHKYENVESSGISGAYGFFGSSILKTVKVKTQ